MQNWQSRLSRTCLPRCRLVKSLVEYFATGLPCEISDRKGTRPFAQRATLIRAHRVDALEGIGNIVHDIVSTDEDRDATEFLFHLVDRPDLCRDRRNASRKILGKLPRKRVLRNRVIARPRDYK